MVRTLLGEYEFSCFMSGERANGIPIGGQEKKNGATQHALGLEVQHVAST